MIEHIKEIYPYPPEKRIDDLTFVSGIVRYYSDGIDNLREQLHELLDGKVSEFVVEPINKRDLWANLGSISSVHTTYNAKLTFGNVEDANLYLMILMEYDD